jgi:hypothetical protein
MAAGEVDTEAKRKELLDRYGEELQGNTLNGQIASFNGLVSRFGPFGLKTVHRPVLSGGARATTHPSGYGPQDEELPPPAILL